MAISTTGVPAEFGVTMCRTFVAADYHVIDTTRREDKSQQLAKELDEQFYPLETDIPYTESIQNALSSLLEHLSGTDCLVNNAGLALGSDTADKADFGDWETTVQTNIIGLTSLTRRILPQMVARKQGHIINLGLIADSYAYPGSNVYDATKAFMCQLSTDLCAELADENIRIANIEPGLCDDTEFPNVRFKNDDQRTVGAYKNVELIQPRDITDTTLWLYQRPTRMNVDSIEIMPVAQIFAGIKVYRDEPAPAKEETFKKQSMSLSEKIGSWFK